MLPDRKYIAWSDNELIRYEANFDGNKPFSLNNKVYLVGTLESTIEFSHLGKHEVFVKTVISVKRLSGVRDFIPIVFPKKYMRSYNQDELHGKRVEIGGEFRTYRTKYEYGGRRCTEFFVFARYFKVFEQENLPEGLEDTNIVYLNGNLARESIYRITPLGREIAEAVVYINRKNENIKDYIPCIGWGMTAIYISNIAAGKGVELYGRIQSRDYFKVFSDEQKFGEERTAYEVSITKIKMIS